MNDLDSFFEPLKPVEKSRFSRIRLDADYL